jgi:wyosine [tRNA(Phe)-imidazoG37] synthetase (radical SAM superfamily)
MTRADVRQDLAQADIVVAKVDAPDEQIFQAINRPLIETTLEEILAGIRRFRQEATSRLALQMMFIEANLHRAAEMAAIARTIQPDEVQLNTPLRPSPVPPLSSAAMAEIEAAFIDLPVFQVYRAIRPSVDPLNPEETRRRRPED